MVIPYTASQVLKGSRDAAKNRVCIKEDLIYMSFEKALARLVSRGSYRNSQKMEKEDAVMNE